MGEAVKVMVIGHNVENVVRAFASRGHDAADILPAFALLPLMESAGADLVIAFPPCKYLCSSGLHWNTRRPERAALTEASLDLVQRIMALPAPRICVENPVGCISSRIRKPDQIIQPYEFGHDASKKTCLWLKGLPFLRPTKRVEPRMVNGLPRWGNQFDSGQNNQVNAADRAVARAERWQGVADAMADQWGSL